MRTTTVSEDTWRDATRLLMGLAVSPQTPLSTRDQRVLRAMLCGPFVRGMTAGEAALALYGMGWRTARMLGEETQPRSKRGRR